MPDRRWLLLVMIGLLIIGAFAWVAAPDLCDRIVWQERYCP